MALEYEDFYVRPLKGRKSCQGCKHLQPLSVSLPYVKICTYLLDTGHKRNCSAENCDKYEKGKRKLSRKNLVFGRYKTKNSLNNNCQQEEFEKLAERILNHEL